MIARPAAELLVSLVSEEWRGRPGPAREQALASAQQDREHRADHLMDAAYASLVVGEPRAALRILDEAEAASVDGAIQRRVVACRSWARHLDENWYPGNAGAELREGALSRLDTSISVSPGDSETRLVEACVAHGPVTLFTARNLIENMARQTPLAVNQMLGHALRESDRFREVAIDSGPIATALWASAAAADLTARAGFVDDALGALASVRQVYEELQDRTGLAGTYLMEGDWWATPGSSPEALGVDLMWMPNPSPHAGRRSDERAAAAYRRAGALLQGVDAPRCTGALALRRAALAWRARRFEQQIAWLDTAHRAFADAGDAGCSHVVVIHRLLADIALGDFAAARSAAPTEWAAAPHGPIGRIVEWALDAGSISLCAGLGRLLQRVADSWIAADEAERGERALLLALPLLSLSDAVPIWTILGRLGQADLRRNIPIRPLVRCLGALVRMPADRRASNPTEWLQQLELTSSLLAIPAGMAPSSASMAIRALERGVERLTKLVQEADVYIGRAEVRRRMDISAALDKVARSQAQFTLEDVAEQSKVGTSKNELDLIRIAAQQTRDQIALAQAQIALNKARRAERTGWEIEAEQWYDEAMRRVESAGESAAWLAVLILGARGQREEALARFEEIHARGALDSVYLAPLALRAGEYNVADRLFSEMDQSTASASKIGWPELSDRAEAALGVADVESALDLGRKGIDLFEAAVARLSRDSDRIAATDDISAASLYQLAARACLALANGPDSRLNHDERSAWRRRSFDVGEQARSLTLRILMRELTASGASGEPRSRRLHQVATERSTAYDRLLAAHERNDLDEIRKREQELTAVEAELADIEAEAAPRLLQRTGDTPEWAAPFAVTEVQQQLPPHACLVAYHMVGRDFIRWGVSADSIEASHERFPRHVVEGQVNRLLRACSVGDPGGEASDLARVLLEPFADMLSVHTRVLVIPSGALNAVPFHVLPFRGQPLGATHVLSYLPAAWSLVHTALDDSLSGYGAVVVGDPAFNAQSHPGLRRLAGAALEAAVVGRLYDARDVLVKENATEAKLRPVLQGRAIVHLAAHGHLDEIAPNTSSIVLAGDDQLTVADLIGLHLDAGLTILSACDSGRGSAILGGDVVGLVRGLFAAGVRRCVVSLWPVDDVVACVTMVAFHEELVKGEPPALALALAQRAIRAMSGAKLAARYRELGGEVQAGARSVRRLSGDTTPPMPAIPLDPEFIDADETGENGDDVLEGRLACAWAPFILVGC